MARQARAYHGFSERVLKHAKRINLFFINRFFYFTRLKVWAILREVLSVPLSVNPLICMHIRGLRILHTCNYKANRINIPARQKKSSDFPFLLSQYFLKTFSLSGCCLPHRKTLESLQEFWKPGKYLHLTCVPTALLVLPN